MKKNSNGIKKKYEAREGSPIHNEQHVQSVGEFIENMEDARTPENILKEVKKHPKHIINNYITWDDEKAGHRYRLSQVRNIVNHIAVKFIQVGDESIQIRAFHSVKVKEDTPVEYVPVKIAFSDDYMRAQMIEKAFRELNYWTERYRVYQEFQPVVRVIEDFIKEEEEKNNKEEETIKVKIKKRK